MPSSYPTGAPVANEERRAMRRTATGLLLLALLGCGGGKNRPDEGKSADELRAMLDDPDPQKQAQGALGLSRGGRDALPALPRLTELLTSPDAVVRQQAALAIGKIGPDAAGAVPGLTTLLRDEEWAVRRQ